MKPVFIFENCLSGLNKIEENVSGSKPSYVFGGEFTRFNVVNRNERIYTPENFIPALNELNERIASGMPVYGEWEHPTNYSSSLPRISHIVTHTSHNNEKGIIEGKIKLLSTQYGREARALVDDGLPLYVSSRAAGITEGNGMVSIKKLFTYDCVADPGFATAKMSPLNESLGYSSNSNFRIYDMTDESKTNELFNMNKNEFVTKSQLSEYSNHIVEEIAKTKSAVDKAIKEGKSDVSEIEKMVEQYEALQAVNEKMTQYLDYLSKQVQVVVKENKTLKANQDKLIAHNDYIIEQVQTETSKISEKLDKSILYTEDTNKTVAKLTEYTESVVGTVNKTISELDFISESIKKNKAYMTYIAEELDKNVGYGKYIAEHVDNLISHNDYIVENVENAHKYAQYIAENLEDSIAFGDYVSENLNKSIKAIGTTIDKLNEGSLNESTGSTKFQSLNEFQLVEFDDEFEGEANNFEFEDEDEMDKEVSGFNAKADDEANVADLDEVPVSDNEEVECEETECITCDVCGNEICACAEVEKHDDEVELDLDVTQSNESELTTQINNLISEAKKRKVVETNDLHFLKFLNKSEVNSFYELTNEEREQVTLYINEKSYFSGKDVLTLMSEALATKNETIEEKLIRLLPDSLKATWEQLSENNKKSVFSQAKLYPDLNTDQKVEHFWLTRKMKKNESTKKMISSDALIQEDVLKDSEMNFILEKMKRLS